jgi:hypothetical protein
MRISYVCALSGALLLAGSCSREPPPAPTPAPPAATTAAPTTPPAPAAAPAKDAVFGREQLDQMLAPVALYPDPLLAQVLMAATYPGDVAEAAAWSKAHPDAKGDQAVTQVATQPWDPSVQSLVAFPQALATLGQDPAWVQRLGDAFLAQPDDVMDAVQRLRHQAQSAGNLATNEYQNVTVQPAPAAEPAMGGTTVQSQPESSTIIIEPADPEVVYVPSYDPTEAYGTWAYPSYPPAYYPPPPGYYMGGALAAGLAFGVGVAITDSLWGDFDWDDDDIDIDVDRYNNINTNRQINANNNTWQHNAVNRDGVPYRDRANREQYSRRLDGADTRQAFRGEDAQRARSREQARASMQERGFDAPATSNVEARDRAREADRAQARERARDTQERTQARDRARDTQDRAQARDRTTQQARDRSAQQPRDRSGSSRTAADRSQSQQRKRSSQSSSQARQSARQQHSASSGRTRNNAFEGARSPSSSRAQQSRGQTSHAQSRQSSSRSSGKQVNRQSRAPQRQSRGR